MTEGRSKGKIHLRLNEATQHQLCNRCADLDFTIQDDVAGAIEDSFRGSAKKSEARQKMRRR